MPDRYDLLAYELFYELFELSLKVEKIAYNDTK